MNASNRNLLIVDDEQNVINSLKRLFRGKGYNIHSCNNGKDALTFFQDNHQDDIGVVLSDFQMPGMKGTEFLAEVKKCQPDTIRILLTGQANEVPVTEAVNDGALHKFLDKPWDNQRLLSTIDEAFIQFELVSENKRLTEELADANSELKVLNDNLEQQVNEKAQQLVKAIYYDELTGLPSKALIKDRLDQEIKNANRSASSITVMSIGIDNLTMVNQSLGQQAGDNLLKSIAERLTTSMRASDSVSRITGDKFCLVLPNKNALEKPSVIADRVMAALRSPFILGEQTVFLTASVGMSLFPADSDDMETLISYSESAMRQVKDSGKNNYRFYSKEYGELAHKRFSLESDLRKAVENNEFCLYYQPRIDIRQNTIIGVEALMRWNHPEKGIILPGEFIPLLEETGMIEAVGEWLVYHSIKTLKSWQNQGLPDIHMAVNLSARQFYQGKILEVTQDAINQTGLDISRSNLEYEITESLLIEDVVSARKILDELNNMGIVLAIDDFGTGYSSLSYLIQFPVHYLKVDRSFVMNLEHSKNAKAIVNTIISLAHGLNMEVIAEGIETTSQLNILANMGCHEYQGFLFSKPITELALIDLLKQGKSKIFYSS